MDRYNILITAGGTSEPIDAVRVISNSSSGRLGSMIADELASREDCQVFYVCARDSVRPASPDVRCVEVMSVADLQSAVTRLAKENAVHAAIHSMAVSDYTVRAVSTAGAVAEQLAALDGETVTPEKLEQAFDVTDTRGGGGKLSSKMSSPVLLLTQTPKIISLLRPLMPEAVIVGFKLLSRVSREELLDVAHALLKANGCDFVLANDGSEIRGDTHHAYLIDGDKTVLREMFTKQEIAAQIAETVMKEVRNKQ